MGQIRLKEKSSEVILQTAKDIYNEEMDRFKNTEMKSGILLTALGVILTFYLTYLKDLKVEWITNYTGFYCFFIIVSPIIILCSLLTIWYLFKALKGSKYEQVSINSIVEEEFACCDSSDVAFDIAATYQNVVNKNRKKLENKIENYNQGLYFLQNTIMYLVLYIFLEGVLKFVIK